MGLEDCPSCALPELNPEKLREPGRRPGAFAVKLERGIGEAFGDELGLLSFALSCFSNRRRQGYGAGARGGPYHRFDRT